jgi:AcrR family transcriptional regulator
VAGSTAPKNGRGTVTQERLVRVAADLFREKGYAATTTREIAEKLGIQKGSLYHHVSTKEDLLFWICAQSMAHITSSVTAALAQAKPGEEMRDLIKSHIIAELDDAAMHAVMLIELPALGEARRREVIEFRDDYERLVYETIVRAQASGSIRNDTTARLLTLALLDMLNWAVFWYRKSGSMTAEELGQSIATIFLEGAAKR